MTELKTLNDLTPVGNFAKIFKLEIKAEAIKWIKFYGEINLIDYNVRDFIKRFFNITEEDLEEKQ